MAAWVPLIILLAFALALMGAALALKNRGAGSQRRSAPRNARLEFIHGPLDGQTLSLAGEITTLGSAPGNSIVVPDPAVARKHIGIRRDPDGAGWELADLGSTSGVFVNGHRLAKRLLVPGDIIRIGASEMVFQLEETG